MEDIVLIGEAPGPSTPPEKVVPLYPFPANSAGARLRRLMELDLRTYIGIPRTNLLHEHPGRWTSGRGMDRWPAVQARAAATVMKPLLTGRRVIFVGRRVAVAFGYRRGDLDWFQVAECRGHGYRFTATVIPHTSGRCHFWNDQENISAARRFFSCYLGGEPLCQLQAAGVVAKEHQKGRENMSITTVKYAGESYEINEKQDLNEVPTAGLVASYNDMTHKSIKRFKNRETALARVWNEIQTRHVPQPTEEEKMAARKTAAKAKTTAKKTTAKKTAAPATGRRERLDPDAKITFTSNPYREGSKANARWSAIKTGWTVKKATEAGVRAGDIHYAVEHHEVTLG